MGCGLLGDLIMARVLPFPKPVIGGMLSFGAGHVLYMRALLKRDAARDLSYAPLVPAWAAALACWWALIRRSPAGAPLKYGALAYTPLLGSMLGSKLSNPSPSTTETALVRIDLGPRASTGSARVLPAGLRGPALRGLPLIGFEAVRYINGNVTPGTLANYTLATPLRSSVVCARSSGEPTPCP